MMDAYYSGLYNWLIDGAVTVQTTWQRALINTSKFQFFRLLWGTETRTRIRQLPKIRIGRRPRKNIGPHGGKSEREITTQDKAMFEEDTHGCSKPQDRAGADSPAGHVAVMTGLNQVNRDMVPAAATPTEDKLAEPTTRRITRSQGAITMNSPQVTRNDNPEPTIRDVMDLLKANNLQTTKALDDIRSQMSDFEQSLQFSQAKIAENECGCIHISSITNFSMKTNMALEKITLRNWQHWSLLIESQVIWIPIKFRFPFFSIYRKLSIL